MCCTRQMASEKEIRLENLKEIMTKRKLVNDKGLPCANELLKLTEHSQYSYWQGLLTGKRPFGEEIARFLEDKLQVPRWTLDGGAGWPFPGIPMDAWEKLSRDQRIEIQGIVRKTMKDFNVLEVEESGKGPSPQPVHAPLSAHS